jgi:lipoate-protein ligase A
VALDRAVRLLAGCDDGPHNMAADEVLLEGAGEGVASLRFYFWSEPTVSLGYFQPHTARLAGLPYVRRPSGGLMLVHHHELTYCLALPAGSYWQGGEPWLRRMHNIISAALAALGVTARPHHARDMHHDTPLCFGHLTTGDLLIDGHKVIGSAQRKQRGALMQHGSILLARSPFTPELPGIRELTGRNLGVDTFLGVDERTTHAIETAFVSQTGWPLLAGNWELEELRRIKALVEAKYTRPEWNDKR